MQEVLAKLSLRELRLVLLGIGAVISVGITGTLLIPTAKALIVARESVRVLEIASQDGAALDQQLRDAEQVNADLRFRLYGDMAQLPAKQVEAHIIGRLQEISWAAHIDLVSVEPAQGEQVQIFQETLFKVEVSGQFADLYRWLWDVRQDLGYVVVKEYALKRISDDDLEPVLQANLSLASYRAVE